VGQGHAPVATPSPLRVGETSVRLGSCGGPCGVGVRAGSCVSISDVTPPRAPSATPPVASAARGPMPSAFFARWRPPRRPGRTTVPAPPSGELCETWLTHARVQLAANIVAETRRHLHRHLLPARDVALAALRPEHLDHLYRDLLEHGSDDGKPLSGSTVRRIHGVAHRALGCGVRWGWSWTNPATGTLSADPGHLRRNRADPATWWRPALESDRPPGQAGDAMT